MWKMSKMLSQNLLIYDRILLLNRVRTSRSHTSGTQKGGIIVHYKIDRCCNDWFYNRPPAATDWLNQDVISQPTHMFVNVPLLLRKHWHTLLCMTLSLFTFAINFHPGWSNHNWTVYTWQKCKHRHHGTLRYKALSNSIFKWLYEALQRILVLPTVDCIDGHLGTLFTFWTVLDVICSGKVCQHHVWLKSRNL